MHVGVIVLHLYTTINKLCTGSNRAVRLPSVLLSANYYNYTTEACKGAVPLSVELQEIARHHSAVIDHVLWYMVR